MDNYLEYINMNTIVLEYPTLNKELPMMKEKKSLYLDVGRTLLDIGCLKGISLYQDDTTFSPCSLYSHR
jgi:hypothetical protein